MQMKKIMSLAILMTSLAGPSIAAVPASEAAELGGPRLTEFGSERAGNADGSIPEWTPDWKGPVMPPEGGLYPDPFTDEKPLFSITAANAGEYENRLSAGTRLRMKAPS